MNGKQIADGKEQIANSREKEENKGMNVIEHNGLYRRLRSNPADLHVYGKKQHHRNTIPAGIAQPMYILHFYKHLMPQASAVSLTLLPLTSANGKETAPLTTGLQPHLMWLKPVTFMKSANRQLKQTAIEQREGRTLR